MVIFFCFFVKTVKNVRDTRENDPSFWSLSEGKFNVEMVTCVTLNIPASKTMKF